MSLSIEKKDLDDITSSHVDYLPGGELWDAAAVEGTNIHALMRGLSTVLLDVETFNRIYSSEFIPSLEGTSFLENWERAVSIPDECFPGASESDRSIRMLHVLVKLASLGVQTRADFERLAEILGFPGTTVTSGIDEGIAEIDGQFTIVVKFNFLLNKFPLEFPIFFGTDQFNILKCLFEKLIPENCVLQFGFL